MNEVPLGDITSVFGSKVIGAVSSVVSVVCSGVSCASVFVCVVRRSAGMARS